MILGAGVIPYCLDTKRFLLNLRSKGVNEPYTWCTWGGRKEKDETFLQCAKREFREESGYDKDPFLTSSYVYKSSGLVFYTYIYEMKSQFEPVITFESQDAKWFSFQEMINLRNLHFGLKAFLNSEVFYNFMESH